MTARGLRVRPLRHLLDLRVGRTAARLAPRLRRSPPRTRIDWAHQVEQLLTVDYPDAETVVLVMDNLNTHSHRLPLRGVRTREGLRPGTAAGDPPHPQARVLAQHRRDRTVRLTRQCLDRRIADLDTLNTELAAWQHATNADQRQVDWQFTTGDARIKLRHLYPNN